MKLKKLLSGFLAAAMAVTTMVTASVTVWADKDLSLGSFTSGTLEDNPYVEGQQINNPTITLDSDWSNAIPVDGYSSAVITYTCGKPENVENLYLVAQNGTMPNGWFSQAVAPAASGTITLDLSTVQDKTYNALVVQIEPKKDSFSIGDSFEANFEVTSAKLVSAVADTTEYADQPVSPLPALKDGTLMLEGTFDVTKINGPGAYIEVKWTTTTTEWPGFKLVPANDFKTEIYTKAVDSVGQQTTTIMLKDIADKLQEHMWISTWGGISIDSITIHNDINKGNVYDPTPAYSVAIGDDIENGAVEADVKFAKENDTVTLTVTPDEGYAVDEIMLYSWDGDKISDVDVSKEPYTFAMPAQNVSVAATFKKAEIALTGITLNKTTAAVLVGDNVALTATKVPSTTTDETDIEWTSSAPAVATVDQTGKVTGVAAGTATITAACGDIKATCTVTVSAEAKPCTAITLDKTTATVMKGATVTLTATPTPADTTDTTITWESSDTSIATVKDGVVTAVARGVATITVKCGEKSATCKVSVNEEETLSAPKSFKSAVTDGKYNKNDVLVISAADVAAAKSVTITVTDNNRRKTTKDVTECYKMVTYKAADGTTDTISAGANFLIAVTVTGIPDGTTVTVTATVNK